MSIGRKKIDYLIVGQGLAGSLLARALLARGRTVMVVDRENPSSASRVAAGLINPVTGRNLVLTWRGAELLPFAREYYRNWERELGAEFYAEKPIWRFFGSDQEAKNWEKKRGRPGFAEETEELPEDAETRFPLQPNLEGFVIRRGAHVNARHLLQLFRDRLRERQILIEENFSATDLLVRPEAVYWRDFAAKRVIFCEGPDASGNPFFSWIPFKHSKGEVLTVEVAGFSDEAVLHRGKWLLPVGKNRFRAGATYKRELSETLTEAGKQEILDGIGRMISVAPKLLLHEVGIRPIVQDRRPIAGLHPAEPQIGIFNGLASKGVLWGPFFAEQFADALENGGALDLEIDVRRNL